MALPLLLLLFAAIPAAVVAYGIDPNWAQYPHGLQLILFSRRFEWPMIALTLVLSVAVLGLVISGKKRGWWLIGLAPILTLLGHRFAINPNNAFLVNSDPVFVSADRASFVSQDDWVVGIIDGSDAVAFPFASLYSRPLVVRNQQSDPMILMWSPFANCVSAYRIERSIRTNELEIVSMPANALLVYNSRVGQFINGMTGLTPGGQQPSGFISRISAIKTKWNAWLGAHPSTLVLAPPELAGESPNGPVLPYFPMPPAFSNPASNVTVALIGVQSPVAVMDSDLIAGMTNLSNPAILVLRDPNTRALIAFDRHVEEDLIPSFSRREFKKFPLATMTDSDSGSAWTADGRAVDGPLKGKKLKRLEIEDGVYWNIARFWFGNPPVLAPPAG